MQYIFGQYFQYFFRISHQLELFVEFCLYELALHLALDVQIHLERMPIVYVDTSTNTYSSRP